MTRRALRALFAARRLGAAALDPLRRWRHRAGPFVRSAPMAEAQPRTLEGYPEKLWAPSGEPRAVHLRSPFPANALVVERYAGPEAFEEVARAAFEKSQPSTPADAPSAGCGWPIALTLGTDGWPQGTYRARIEAGDPAGGAPDPEAADRSAITFLVGPAAPGARVAVLAPVTTWLAYNPYGGQSLYHNEIDPGATTYASHAHRPNPALSWAPVGAIHAMAAEAPVFAWLDAEVGADLYPDWMLEHPERLASYDLIVLAYHCEYASDAMRAGLDALVDGGRSLLALGGNQLYWRARWDADHTAVECRKDGSRFSDGARGGLWRHRGRPEDETLGVRFTPPGTGTYAPYRVADAGHWLFDGLDVREGDLFGHEGTTPLPICGDETDAPTRLSGLGTHVIARGMNRPDAIDGDYTLWQPRNAAWNGSAGGTIALTERSERHAVLATGAIHSPSGLGADAVFTGVVRNFLNRYVR